MSIMYEITREQVTWIRWDAAAMRNRISHPWQWIVTEPDGYRRCFDTRRDAEQWITENR